jgi:hypothetical protein
MPAPTALLRKPEELADAASIPLPTQGIWPFLLFLDSSDNL